MSMKSKAVKLLKKITLVLASMARSKTIALKHKTSALRTRFMIFSLLRDKKVLFFSISHKLQALVTNQEHNEQEEQNDNMSALINVVEDQSSNSIVVYNNHSSMSLPSPSQIDQALADLDEEDQDEEEDHEKFPDLTHSLFDLELEDAGGSVIDIVKKWKKGEEFKLEDEIDQVADLFIKRFHRQMRMQKQLSIKRYEEMLQMSA